MQTEGKASQAAYKVTHVPEALRVPQSKPITSKPDFKSNQQLAPQSSSSTSTTSTTSSSTSSTSISFGSSTSTTRDIIQAQKVERDLGVVSESGFLRSAERFLGKNYVVHPKGRYVSKDGSRQVRYGKHETRQGKEHHAHFEAYDTKTGKLDDRGRVVIINDK